MKYLSLFSGVGGFELGIQRAYENKLDTRRVTGTSNTKNRRDMPMSTISNGDGRRTYPNCIGFSEIDKYAIKTYQHHFPNHKNYGDITKIQPEDLPDFELLVGGFPCQSFSIAGLRRGFEDTRGTLFFEIARIVKQKQPRLLLLENVKGLLSHDKGSTFLTIITTLDALGYDCQWQVLNAKDFGVPQNRERVFIVGHLRGTPRPEVFPIGESSVQSVEQLNNPKHSNDRIYGTDGISPTLNTMQGGRRQPFIQQRPRGKNKGNTHTTAPSITGKSYQDNNHVVHIPEATKKGYAEAREGDSINLSVINSKTRRGRVGRGIAQTVDTGMQQHTLTKDAQIRRLTPLECERLMSWPDNWTNVDGMSDTQRYKQCGNGVISNVVAHILNAILKRE